MFGRSQGLLPCHSFSFSPRRRFVSQTEISGKCIVLVSISLLFFSFPLFAVGIGLPFFCIVSTSFPGPFPWLGLFGNWGVARSTPQDPPSYSPSDSPNSQSFPEVRLGTESPFCFAAYYIHSTSPIRTPAKDLHEGFSHHGILQGCEQCHLFQVLSSSRRNDETGKLMNAREPRRHKRPCFETTDDSKRVTSPIPSTYVVECQPYQDGGRGQ